MKRALFIASALLLWSAQFSYAAPKWERVVVHISDSTHMTQEECNDWHNQRGWDGCGYNFVVEPEGTLPDGSYYGARGWAGHGWDERGTHVAGKNSTSLGFCFVSKDKATPEQLIAFQMWYEEVVRRYGPLPIYPHNHFNKSKTCGLEIMKQLKTLRIGTAGFNSFVQTRSGVYPYAKGVAHPLPISNLAERQSQ